MGLLDRFEQSLERLLEGTTGALFRQKLQPAEIGKRLERAMLNNQRPSVGSNIVPNDYTVRLHPKDFAQFEGYAAGLARQMESWLSQVASRENLTLLDKIDVRFLEDRNVSHRNPRIDASITDHAVPSRSARRRTRPTRVDETSTIDVARTGAKDFQLRGIAGPAAGATFTLPEGTSTIGRSTDNTIVLVLPDVSRRHARLERSGSHIRIYDLNSTNGTRVNGEAVHISDVQEGDEIQIGSQRMELIGVHPPANGDWTR